MGFNLNTAAGFASLTLGGAATALQQLTGAISKNWDIDEGSYGHDGQQVLFHVFKTSSDFDAAVGQVQDSAGRRKVPIIFPYQDGQSTDDVGRNGETIDIDILIFGPKYKNQYKKLLKELNDPRPGSLVHPVRGQMTVAAESWTVTHASDQKQAVSLRVRFIEHSFSVSYSSIPDSKDVRSALTSAISFIGKVASAVTFAQSVLFVASNTRNLVAALLSGYQQDFTDTLLKLNQTFNPGDQSLIPGLAPTVSGQDPNVFPTAASPTSDAFAETGTAVAGQTSQALNSALAAQQAVDTVKALRAGLQEKIEQIESTEGGQGSLIFQDQVLMLKQSAISMQTVLEQGLQSSRNRIITYTTPRDMSVREVCFANGISVDASYDIEVLNPDLLSLNLIPAGTVLQVPV